MLTLNKSAINFQREIRKYYKKKEKVKLKRAKELKKRKSLIKLNL